MNEKLFNERKEMLLEVFSDSAYKPMKLKELCVILNVPKSEKESFKQVLDSLIAEGKLMVNLRGKYKIPGDEQVRGVFCGTAKGFGFVTIEGRDDDIFIPESCTKDAMHGDSVLVKIHSGASGGRRTEGEIIKVTDHVNKEVIGTYQKSKNFGFVVPDNQKINCDLFIPKKHSMGAVNGHKVVAKITDYGEKDRNPEGKIVEIIGHINDPGTDILSIIKAHDLPVEFPEDVMTALKYIPESVSAEEIKKRKDLRNLKTVTIDGEDAKDLDDAITLEKSNGVFKLGVHIADVTHYVKEGSPLDKEAIKRGTSVYLVDRVIPMLPHKLSNGICSLNQGEDRLALSCLMEINEKGQVISHEICKTVIQVNERMTYTAVNSIIEKSDSGLLIRYGNYAEMFLLMKELADVLRENRKKRGGIDFEFPETKILLDENGKPVDVFPYERNAATKIIEDFMLMANETVAEDFFWQEIPFLYRTHETPDMEKIEKLSVFIKNFGYYLKTGTNDIHPKEFQKLLWKIEGTPEEALISRLTLRSMKQAKYTTENSGHFGLAVKYYCHFTSPIRRYPDLQIHRIIKENIDGRLNEKRLNYYQKILPEVANLTSLLERRADEAEREISKLKKVEYMSGRIGKIYDGVISGVTGYGMYVELPNTCEGMVRLQSMEDDYYFYDESQFALVGEITHKTYKLGEKVRIMVIAADKGTKTIDFKLIDDCTED